jgi:antitoxin component of RelBE/YafQ-DinJ toxin-antitoxin module
MATLDSELKSKAEAIFKGKGFEPEEVLNYLYSATIDHDDLTFKKNVPYFEAIAVKKK